MSDLDDLAKAAKGRARVNPTSPPQSGHGAFPEQTQLIEKTSKRWKKHQLFAGLIFVAGLFPILFGVIADNNNEGHGALLFSIGVVVALGGATYGVIIETFIWWHHG
jgi:hypothetical protein